EYPQSRERASNVPEGLAAVLRNLSGPSAEAAPRQVDPGPTAAPSSQTMETRNDRVPSACGLGCPGAGRNPYGAAPPALVVRSPLSGSTPCDAPRVLRSLGTPSTRTTVIS